MLGRLLTEDLCIHCFLSLEHLLPNILVIHSLPFSLQVSFFFFFFNFIFKLYIIVLVLPNRDLKAVDQEMVHIRTKKTHAPLGLHHLECERMGTFRLRGLTRK